MTGEQIIDPSIVTVSRRPSHITHFPEVKILIVDDNQDGARALSNLIESQWKMDDWPLRIVVATTMAEALHEAKDSNATFLDLELPDSPVEETIGRIHLFQPPVIVLTGHEDETVDRRCKDAGADYVYIKGLIEGLIPSLFESLQKDLIRRFREVYGKR